MTQDEKKKLAGKWWGILSDEMIKTALSISRASFDRWTKQKREDHEAQLKQQIYDLWLRCETQSKIEEITGISQQRASYIIAKIRENSKNGNTAIFRDFSQEGSALRIYDIWNSPRLRSALFE